MLAETYLELITDPSHWMFEITLMVLIDGLLIGVGWNVFKRWLKNHDKVHHGHECDE